jgi:FkbM family methyltransferase
METKESKLKTFAEGTEAIIDKIFDNPLKKIGVTWLQLRSLKYFPKKGLQSHTLFGNQTYFYGIKEYFYGLKEIFADEIYLQNLPDNAYIIDCGAHIGLSIIYLKRLCPTANIIAFEPDETNFAVLKKNIQSHHLSSVDLKKEAIWINNATLSFISEGNMSSKIGTVEDSTVQVQAIRLKDLLTRRIDFLKLDIEGAEYEVIKDIQDQLSVVQNVFIEYHGSFNQNNELNDLLRIVAKSGFQYYIKEATAVYKHPFLRSNKNESYDVQLNIFCFRN